MNLKGLQSFQDRIARQIKLLCPQRKNRYRVQSHFWNISRLVKNLHHGLHWPPVNNIYSDKPSNSVIVEEKHHVVATLCCRHVETWFSAAFLWIPDALPKDED